VAWQDLLDDSGDGSVLDDSGAGKASVAAAVLTTRRLLLASATLRVLAAYAPSPAQPPPTSLLWLGPALLFATSAHQARDCTRHVAEPRPTLLPAMAHAARSHAVAQAWGSCCSAPGSAWT
jgi:hypothetical protein